MLRAAGPTANNANTAINASTDRAALLLFIVPLLADPSSLVTRIRLQLGVNADLRLRQRQD